MRRASSTWCWFAITLISLGGCQGPQTLKPKLHEHYILPPSDDPRFSAPPAFPKETLDSGQMKKDEGKMLDQLRGPSGRFGAGPGMGGMGSMGGGGY